MRATSSLLAVASAAFAVVAVVFGMGSTSHSALAVALPPANGQFDYQIGGAYTPGSTVSIVDRDRSASPVVGRYNLCYVNAFQTQPDEASFWTSSHSDLLVKRPDGSNLTDPDWPGEFILNTSTAAKRSSIATIVNGWIDGCKAKGFQAIEPDNLDSWSRSLNTLTETNNVDYATLLATHAHAIGLAIAQKNGSELGATGKTTVGFDFAIAEECQVYSECGAYTGPYGNSVIEIEYTDNARSAYTQACAAQGKNISVILRDRKVVARGQSAYRYEYC